MPAATCSRGGGKKGNADWLSRSMSMAHSRVVPGRYVISLPEALCHAGVGSVLGSLWPVDDRSAVAFMSRFYELLKDHRRDDALRQTQLDCAEGKLMADGEPVGTSPYYWAGFVLYGDGGRLQL